MKHSVIPGSAKVVRRELVDLDEMDFLVSGGQHTMARRTLGLVNEAAARGLTPLQLPSASGHPPPPT